MITLERLHHCGVDYISLRFAYDERIKRKIKTLNGIKYTKTHRCWYIPNSWEAYNEFLKLGLEYNRKETSQAKTGTRPSSKKSDNSCIADNTAKKVVSVKVRGKPRTDINAQKEALQKIVWQGGSFIIFISYDKEEGMASLESIGFMVCGTVMSPINLESGTQQRLIQKLLGHQSSKTTEIYTHVSRTSLENVISPLDIMIKMQNND